MAKITPFIGGNINIDDGNDDNKTGDDEDDNDSVDIHLGQYNIFLGGKVSGIRNLFDWPQSQGS